MRFIYILPLLFISVFCSAQSVSYYRNTGDNGFSCISVLSPGTNINNAKVFYNSSNSSEIFEIKSIKQVRNDTLKVSLVSIGSGSNKYYFVVPSSGKYVILSDLDQKNTGVYTMDSKIYNPSPVIKSSPISNDAMFSMLKLAAKLLLF